VERYEVVHEMHSRIPEIRPGEWGPYVLYTLGDPIVPNPPTPTGKVYPSGRVWAMIDLLLTCDTVSEARDETRRRLEQRREQA
jgi:hypothetical protein